MRIEDSKQKHLKKKTVYAKKSFGQNFLVDPNYIAKIISALDPQKNETIIEIGAGRGALTKHLIDSGAKIIAIELDRDLIPVLEDEFGHNENFEIIENDALQIDFSRFSLSESGSKPKLVANLPYYISTAILQRLIEYRETFAEMILMFQREVVQRITAEPGNKERGFLTVFVEAFINAEKLFDVPPNAFRPAPKVESSVVRLTAKNKGSGETINADFFREIISCGFRQKRKTLLNNLKNAPEIVYKNSEKKDYLAEILKETKIDPNRRAEDLTLDEWLRLTEALDKNE